MIYIKAYLTHVDTGIGATDTASYSDQRFKYREPNFPDVTIVHRMDVDGPIPYFLCTATDNYDMDTEDEDEDKPIEEQLVNLNMN